MGDPWFNDLWNDPFDWGQRSPLLSFSSSSPCGSGLSIVSPSSLVRRRKDEVSSKQMECRGCQKDVPKEELNTVSSIKNISKTKIMQFKVLEFV